MRDSSWERGSLRQKVKGKLGAGRRPQNAGFQLGKGPPSPKGEGEIRGRAEASKFGILVGKWFAFARKVKGKYGVG